MKTMLRAAALVLVLAFVGCSEKGFNLTVEPKPVPGVDWSQYTTWKFARQGEYPVTGNPVLDEPTFRKSVGDNTVGEMDKLGYKHVNTEEADMLLMYHVIVEDRFDDVKMNPAYQDFDMQWAQANSDDTWQEGSVALFAVDAKTGKQIWGSVARAELDKQSNMDTKKQRFNQAVDEMLADFPKKMAQ